MPPLYDRPVAELMQDAAAEISDPAQPRDLIKWFAARYPDVKSTTVRAHVKGLTANDSRRHHYRWLARREALFARRRDGSLMPFDASATSDAENADRAEDEELEVGLEERELEFALEAYLEEFLLTNFDRIDWAARCKSGSRIRASLGTSTSPLSDAWTPMPRRSRRHAGRGRAQARAPIGSVVGQAARYMGCVRAHLARRAQRVQGLIVAHEHDDRLAYAVAEVPNLSVLTYEIDFRLSAPPGSALTAS